MGFIENLKLAVRALSDADRERDGIYTLLNVILQYQELCDVRVDLKIRYDNTVIERSNTSCILSHDGMRPKNKSVAVFFEYELRNGSAVQTGRGFFIPLSKITSIEITKYGLRNEDKEEKGVQDISADLNLFSKN